MRKKTNAIDNFLTRDDTKIMKGIVILFMLIHSFFCYYFNVPAKIVAYPKYAIPSLMLLVVMTYIASVLLGYFWKGIGFVYRKGHSVRVNFKRFGASGEKR